MLVSADASRIPDELAESLVVGEGAVVFLSEDMVDIFHSPVVQQLSGALGLCKTRSGTVRKRLYNPSENVVFR